MRPIVGVDPGGASTGVIARVGDNLVQHAVIEAATFPDYYRGAVLDELELAYEAAWRAIVDLTRPIVAVEAVVAPNPHVRMMNVKGILATAEVIGWIQERCAQRGYLLIMVPPGGHGSAPLRSYPSRLVGAKEKTGGGRLRHARSAWDIGHVGAQLAIRDPGLVQVPSVESPPMTAEPAKEVTPKDVSRMVRRVNLGRTTLTKALADTVRACAASGYTAKQIVEGDGTDDGKISRQRVYQMLKGDDHE